MQRADGSLIFGYTVDAARDARALSGVVPPVRSKIALAATAALGGVLIVWQGLTGRGVSLPGILALLVPILTLWLLRRQVGRAIAPFHGQHIELVLGPTGLATMRPGARAETGWAEFDRWRETPAGFLVRQRANRAWQMLPAAAIPEPERPLVRALLADRLGPPR